jgi:hypothetical protein
MKIRHVEAVFLEYDDPFFFLSQSRQAAKKDRKKTLRLCERCAFSPGIKTGSTFSRNVSLFSSVQSWAVKFSVFMISREAVIASDNPERSRRESHQDDLLIGSPHDEIASSLRSSQ